MVPDLLDRAKEPVELEGLLDDGVGAGDVVAVRGERGGDDDHWDVAKIRSRAHLLEQRVAVRAGEHQIEQDDVGRGVPQPPQRFVRVTGEEHLVALFREEALVEVGELGVVLDREDPLRAVHYGTSCRRMRARYKAARTTSATSVSGIRRGSAESGWIHT